MDKKNTECLLLKRMSPAGFSMILSLVLILFSAQAISSRGITTTVKKPPAMFLNTDYRALVIGNDSYRDPEGVWKPLKTAVSDAEALSQLLKDKYQFAEVELLTNASRRDILRAFNKLASSTEKNDSVIIYYAGHGYLNDDTGEGYWIPVDAEGGDESTFIRNSTIRDEISVIAKRAKHTLLISDSCFSGELLRQGGRGTSFNNSRDYYKKIAQRKSVQIVAAGGSEFVDDNYANSGHSPFTYFLLNELNTSDTGVFTASELSTSVQRLVASNVHQTPEHGVLYGAGHEGGEFVFALDDDPLNEPAPAVAAVPVAPVAPPVVAPAPQKPEQVALNTTPAPVVVDKKKSKVEQRSNSVQANLGNGWVIGVGSYTDSYVIKTRDDSGFIFSETENELVTDGAVFNVGLAFNNYFGLGVELYSGELSVDEQAIGDIEGSHVFLVVGLGLRKRQGFYLAGQFGRYTETFTAKDAVFGSDEISDSFVGVELGYRGGGFGISVQGFALGVEDLESQFGPNDSIDSRNGSSIKLSYAF